MPKPSRTYLLIEERLGTDLAQYAADRRRDGATWAEISFDLGTRTKVIVTSETLRIWFAETEAARKGKTA